MNASAKKVGPLAYALTSVVIYGLVINCGAKPSLSRISSKCRTESDASGEVKKEPASPSTSKKTSKTAALTTDSDASAIQENDETITLTAGLELNGALEPSDAGLGLADDPEAYYDANVKAIMESKCAGCHAPSRTPPTLDTYANVKKQSADVLRTMRATDKSVMPPAGPLPDSDVAKVAQWALLLSGTSTGSATSTSKATGSSTSTSTTKNPKTSSTASQDECKPVNTSKGTSTATGTGKGTKPKGAVGTSTSGGKK